MLETKMSFLNSVNHEIRTPLNSILGFSALLLDRNYDIEKVKELSQNINNSGNRLKFYLENLILILELKDKLYCVTSSKIEFRLFLHDLITSINENLSGQDNFVIEVNYNSELFNTTIQGDKRLLIKLLSSLILDNIFNDIEGKVNILYRSNNVGSVKVKRIKEKRTESEIESVNTNKKDSFSKEINTAIANQCLEIMNEYVSLYSNYSTKQTNFEIHTPNK